MRLATFRADMTQQPEGRRPAWRHHGALRRSGRGPSRPLRSAKSTLLNILDGLDIAASGKAMFEIAI
jgi:hypothetical protein